MDTNDKIFIVKDDYDLIMQHLRQGNMKSSYEPRNATELMEELRKATVVDKDKMPPNVVRLNSTVYIKEAFTGKEIEVKIVTPGKADIRNKRISILSPMGTALIGFKKGQTVEWNVPGGKKTFLIKEVLNED